VPPIPTPVRAALGLLANAVDAARTLPDRAVELPVLAVSTALQFSLRAQQRYAELAMRGDEVIGRFHGPPDEPPAWATFDDAPAEPNGTGGSTEPTSVLSDPSEPASALSDPTEPASAQSEPTSSLSDPSEPTSSLSDPSEPTSTLSDPSEPTSTLSDLPEPTDADDPASADPPGDIPITAGGDPAAPVRSAAKQPRIRKAPAKKAAAEPPKTLPAPRQAEPSPFDRTDDE
jgi:hypothetical protein